MLPSQIYLAIFFCDAGERQTFMSAMLFLIMDVLECDDDATEYENFDSDPDPRFCAIFCFFELSV